MTNETLPSLYKLSRNSNIICWTIGYKVTSLGVMVYTTVINNYPNGKPVVYEQNPSNKKGEDILKLINTVWKRKKREGYSEIGQQRGIDLIVTIKNQLKPSLTDNDGRKIPMKAHPFKADTFRYPGVLQPKINGVRGIALHEIGSNLFQESSIEIYSNRNKKYDIPWLSEALYGIIGLVNINGINEELELNLSLEDISFDGELYHHGTLLQEIRHKVASTKQVDYYIFDIACDNVSQFNRLELLNSVLTLDFNYFENNTKSSRIDDLTIEDTRKKIVTIEGNNIYMVKGFIVDSDENARILSDKFIELGYEGGILRSFDGEYQYGRRSTDLMKFKKYYSRYFTIIDIIPAPKDNYAGQPIGKFVCRNDLNGKTFDVNPQGAKEGRMNILKNKQDYIGKEVLIKFYERTADKIPFHANVVSNPKL